MASAKPSHTNESWSVNDDELFPKSHVEKFLAECWHNLMTTDDVHNTQSAANAGTEDHKEYQSHLPLAKRRGRPLSDLSWLPLGWERFTKTRSSGQRDTFYREMETNRTMRSAYDVTSYLEFGKIIRKGKERVKPVLEAKYGVKFPKERRREIVLLLEPEENEALALPEPPAGSLTEDPAADHHHQGGNLKAIKECQIDNVVNEI